MENKEELIQKHITEIMKILELDLSDDSLCDTPKRIAKMYTRELFAGLITECPKMTRIKNTMQYSQMLIQTNIECVSTCEHHFLPMLGRCHIAYIPADWVLGLSKFNRLVRWCGQRPQVQERLTQEIQGSLITILETHDIAVCCDLAHTCIRARGALDSSSVTRTTALAGAFMHPEVRSEFLAALPNPTAMKL